MRPRDRILQSLESAYREAFDAARDRGDEEAMSRLDFEYQLDQIRLEVLLDLRALLATPDEGSTRQAPAEESKKERSLLEEGSALIEKAASLRRITRLR